MKVLDLMENYQHIYNKEDKSLFIEHVYGHIDDVEKIKTYIRILNQTGKIESFLDKDLSKFTLTDFVFLFEKRRWISTGTFYVRKSFLVGYMDWSVKNGKTEFRNLESLKLMDSSDLTGNLVFEVSMFRDLDELILANESIINNESNMQRMPSGSTIMSETITYLIWMRLSIDEICDLKYTDIDFKNKKIKLSNRIIDIPYKILNKIEDCYNTKELAYYIRGKLNYRPYILSPYLIKSTTLGQMTSNALLQVLTGYSELSGNLPLSSKVYNKNFKYNTIYMSSVFASIYKFEIENNINIEQFAPSEKLELLNSEFLNEKITAVTVNDYSKWKKFYYN